MTEIAQIDQEISKIEAVLVSLQTARLNLLEEEVRNTRERLDKMNGVSSKPLTRSRAESSVPSKKFTGKAQKANKPKRSRMSSEEVVKRILAAIEAAGLVGISMIAISKDSGVNYQTVAKKLKEGLKGVKKTGEGKGARYFL